MTATEPLTGTAADLYRAILEYPFDDAPRLILADHFDENGEPERANRIRSEIASGVISGGCAGSLEDGLPCPFCENNITFEWSRGFISAVSLTLRQFMGGECERCEGRGKTGMMSMRDGWVTFECKDCKGTGRIPGLADTICARWPVTSVSILGADPWAGIDNEDSRKPSYWWVHGGERYLEERYFMPEELWTKVASGPAGRRIANTFPSRESALLALSHACVDESRERAGLPGIPWRNS